MTTRELTRSDINKAWHFAGTGDSGRYSPAKVRADRDASDWRAVLRNWEMRIPAIIGLDPLMGF